MRDRPMYLLSHGAGTEATSTSTVASGPRDASTVLEGMVDTVIGSLLRQPASGFSG